MILWLKGGGLKDDCDSIDNDQKDNDEKKNGDTNYQSPNQGCLLVLQQPAKSHPVHHKIILTLIVIKFILTMEIG